MWRGDRPRYGALRRKQFKPFDADFPCPVPSLEFHPNTPHKRQKYTAFIIKGKLVLNLFLPTEHVFVQTCSKSLTVFQNTVLV